MDAPDKINLLDLTPAAAHDALAVFFEQRGDPRYRGRSSRAPPVVECRRDLRRDDGIAEVTARCIECRVRAAATGDRRAAEVD